MVACLSWPVVYDNGFTIGGVSAALDFIDSMSVDSSSTVADEYVGATQSTCTTVRVEMDRRRTRMREVCLTSEMKPKLKWNTIISSLDEDGLNCAKYSIMTYSWFVNWSTSLFHMWFYNRLFTFLKSGTNREASMYLLADAISIDLGLSYFCGC